MNTAKKFIDTEVKLFKTFLVKFNIIGLAIGTVIGLTLTNSTKIISEELIMPFLETFLKIRDFHNFNINIYNVNINIGLLIAEIIKIACILIIIFICYNIIHIYTPDILQPNYLLKIKKETDDLKKETKKNQIQQKEILNQLNKNTNIEI